MISVDTNLLLYSLNSQAPEFDAARSFLEDLAERSDVVICELVLVELYLLLRNPAVVAHPLLAAEAVSVCDLFRTHPHWRLVESAPIMREVWKLASEPGFPRRKLIDARLALTLLHHGVTEFATRNVKDFRGLGFARVWNPLD